MTKKKTLLIVEDEKEMQTMYQDMLGEKYKLITAGDTKSALNKLKKNKVGLMILDIILPGETGDTFLFKLKQMPQFKDLRVLCVTVLGDLSTQLKKGDPHIACLPKPFDKEKLLRLVSKMII